MWMQILKAAGLPIFGTAFPASWKETIEAANSEGFYESPLRRGIYYATNPHPKTNIWVPPGPSTRNYAVKVFIPGLVRSDLSYLTRVVGTMRHWREYGPSRERLLDMEHSALIEQRDPNRVMPARMPAVLEWWLENFMLIRDVATRKYALNLTSYDAVLEGPERIISRVLDGLGIADLDVDAAISVVTQSMRTQTKDDLPVADHPMADTFDALYEHVHSEKPLSESFLQELNDTHTALVPEIEAAQREAFIKRTKVAKRLKSPTDPDLVDTLVHPQDLRDE